MCIYLYDSSAYPTVLDAWDSVLEHVMFQPDAQGDKIRRLTKLDLHDYRFWSFIEAEQKCYTTHWEWHLIVWAELVVHPSIICKQFTIVWLTAHQSGSLTRWIAPEDLHVGVHYSLNSSLSLLAAQVWSFKLLTSYLIKKRLMTATLHRMSTCYYYWYMRRNRSRNRNALSTHGAKNQYPLKLQSKHHSTSLQR